MARTFIGELVLRLKDEMSGKAKTAAANLDTSIDRIQRAARQLNQTSWGGQFEEKLRKLGTSAGDIDKLKVAWESLHTSMSARNLGKAMQSLEKSNFKTAALTHFSEIASRAKDADTSVRGLTTSLREMSKYALAGGLVYGGVNTAREGILASAEMMREKSRWKDANIPDGERDAAIAEADRLTTKYPSAGLLNMVELARKARAMMGDSERGLAILPDLAKAFVALQSAKGTDAAVQELEGFLKGADVAGLNAPGAKGIESIRQVIGGWVRAAQVEGRDLDVGKFLEFSRYGKMAVPGLSDRFLAGVLPAIVQDYGPSQFGNALNMAYKSFVIGSNSVAGKKNLAAQRDLGIRTGDGKGELVDDNLFGTDPYAWVNQILIPALQKKGIDTANEVEVSKAVAELASNSNATTVLTRMITQKAQIDRLLQQYDAAKGLESADTAAAQDPFVAAKGFAESLREVAAAIKGMPEAIAILNSLSGGLQSFATALRNNDGGAQALLAGAGIGAGVAAWKVTAGIYGLITAGTNLNAAAVSLQVAAASLGGQGVVDNLTGGKKGGWMSKLKDAMPWLYAATKVASQSKGNLGALGYMGAVGGLAYMFPNNDAGKPPPKMYDQGADANRENYRRIWGSKINDAGAWEGGRHRAYSGFGPVSGLTSPYAEASALLDHSKPVDVRGTANVDMGKANAAATEADRVGQHIQQALSVTATPSVNNAQLAETLRLVNAIKAGLQGIGGMVQQATASVSRGMNRNFTDHGVAP
jgi:hypothetical protein